MFFLVLMLLWPFAEIAVFAQIGARIGFVASLFLCLIAAGLGSALIQRQGLKTMAAIQGAARQASVPVPDIFDGFCLYAAGVLLIIPGFISDTVALALLVPPLRRLLRKMLIRFLKARGIVMDDPDDPRNTVIEGEFTRLDDPPPPLLQSDPDHRKERL